MTVRHLAFFILALSSSLLPAADEEGFVSLFNGKDLTGWRPVNVADDTFGVRDGMIVTTGIPTGFMATDRQYENFIIELDWRHLKEAGNSGLFIWGQGLPAPGVPFAKGIEVQILDPGYEKRKGAWEWFTSHGDIFAIWGATMTPVEPIAKNGKRSFPSERRVKPSPEWNHYRAECNNGEIRLSVNGKQVTVARDCVPRKGFICLESEGSEAHFKNIRIKELPSTGATKEQTAEAYEGYQRLFDGKTLGGWKMTPAVQEVWSASGAQFDAKAGGTGEKLELETEKSYKDFVLVVDWKLPAAAKDATPVEPALPAILLRGNKPVAVTAKGAVAKAGLWNRYTITLKGDRCTVILNDQTILENSQLEGIAAEGTIALPYQAGGISYANAFIKEMK